MRFVESACASEVHPATNADPCEKPPEGDGWIHEIKFDGYRSQIVRDAEGVRIFTRQRRTQGAYSLHEAASAS